MKNGLTLETIWEWKDQRSLDSRKKFIENTDLEKKTGIKTNKLVKMNYNDLPEIVIDSLIDVLNGDYKYDTINKVRCSGKDCKMIIDPDEKFAHIVKFHPKMLQTSIDSINLGEFVNPMGWFEEVKK